MHYITHPLESLCADTFSAMNYPAIRQEVIAFIQKAHQGMPVVIGLSGGIDSALVCSLAIDALGPDKVIAVTIKNVRYPASHLALVRHFAMERGIRLIEVDSDAFRQPIVASLGVDPINIKRISSLDARITDLVLRTIAEKEQAIYLGTINATERITGWYPKGALFGDFDPIGGLLKSQVKRLAELQGLPSEIIHTVSGDASLICSGCGELEEFRGIPYDLLDLVLYWYEKGGADGIYQAGERYNVASAVLERITNRITHASHKRGIFSGYPIINPAEKV